MLVKWNSEHLYSAYEASIYDAFNAQHARAFIRPVESSTSVFLVVASRWISWNNRRLFVFPLNGWVSSTWFEKV